MGGEWGGNTPASADTGNKEWSMGGERPNQEWSSGGMGGTGGGVVGAGAEWSKGGNTGGTEWSTKDSGVSEWGNKDSGKLQILILFCTGEGV